MSLLHQAVDRELVIASALGSGIIVDMALPLPRAPAAKFSLPLNFWTPEASWYPCPVPSWLLACGLRKGERPHCTRSTCSVLGAGLAVPGFPERPG